MSLANFHEVRFPMALAFGAVGGPERRTDVVELTSGREVRNAVWANARRRWDIGSAVERLDDLNALVAFFEARRGRFHGFRFRDFTDDRSCAPEQTLSPIDQPLGTGDGTSTVFQLTKAYGDINRPILKPVEGTVRLAIDGVEIDAFTTDPTVGTVTFDTPPSVGAQLSAGFRFDCPVRFDSDRIDASLEGFGAGRIVSVSIIELIG